MSTFYAVFDTRQEIEAEPVAILQKEAVDNFLKHVDMPPIVGINICDPGVPEEFLKLQDLSVYLEKIREV